MGNVEDLNIPGSGIRMYFLLCGEVSRKCWRWRCNFPYFCCAMNPVRYNIDIYLNNTTSGCCSKIVDVYFSSRCTGLRVKHWTDPTIVMIVMIVRDERS